MSKFIYRVLIGGAAACVAGAIGGPVLAAVAWKGVGFAVTGNPLHLIPGGGMLADGADAVGVIGEVASAASDTGDAASSVAELATATPELPTPPPAVGVDILGNSPHHGAELADGAGPDIWNNQSNLNIQLNPPTNVQGVEQGRLITGEFPQDIWNRRV